MFSRILVTYDGSRGATEALRKAAGLSRPCDADLDADLTVLTVFRHHGMLEATLSARRLDDPDNINDLMRANAREIAETGRNLARDEGAPKVRVFVKSGQPARSIVAFAKEHGSDLIVVGSRGLGSAEGFLLGSVSHKITGLAACPVLVA